MIPESAIPVIMVLGIAAALVLVAAALLAWEATQRNLASTMHRVIHMGAPGESLGAPISSNILVATIRRLGDALRTSALFSPQDLAELERTATAAGFDPRRAVPMVIGGKVLLIAACPLVGYIGGSLVGFSSPTCLLIGSFAIVIGMLGPNWALNWARHSHAATLQRGLPDALDLMVVCAEAGLGLESAVDRITTEMARSNPAIAQEFMILGQDLRMSADRGAALQRMGERTGLEGFQRLSGTLSQTLRYGTPLGQALRTLSAEMRDGRMMRLEERAARLPVLLTLPLILFILPCLFIVMGGPAAIKIINAFAQQ